MSLSRKMLEGLGIDEDKISLIIEAHAETVNALKEKAESYKEDAEKFKETEKALTNATKELEELRENGGDWERKYSEEHKAFENYKKEQSTREENSAKQKAYIELLRNAGVSDKCFDSIIKVADLSDKKLVDGKFENENDIVEGIKKDWSGFITTTSVVGANTSTPIKNEGAGKLTKADIYKKDDHGRFVYSAEQRKQALINNMESGEE